MNRAYIFLLILMIITILDVRSGFATIIILGLVLACMKMNYIARRHGGGNASGNDIMIWDQKAEHETPIVNSVNNILTGKTFL